MVYRTVKAPDERLADHAVDPVRGGRPFYVENVARTTIAMPRSDWPGDLRPIVEDLDAAERRALARAWLEDALAEHASIASFARFVMQLLALGAPPDLVREAHGAQRDEIVHAELCFGLASAYHGSRVGPGPLPIDGALAGADDLVVVTVSAVREGCIGETIAALQAEAAHDAASDPAVRAVLQRIAADEARHAVLAWRFVAWAIAQGGAVVRNATADAFVRYARTAKSDDRVTTHAEVLREHGRLSAREQAEVIDRAIGQIIRPSAAALLEELPADPHAADWDWS